MKQAGLGNVKQFFFTGYDQETVANPADAASFDGDYSRAAVKFLTFAWLEALGFCAEGERVLSSREASAYG